jgi:hypothetical protein
MMSSVVDPDTAVLDPDLDPYWEYGSELGFRSMEIDVK